MSKIQTDEEWRDAIKDLRMFIDDPFEMSQYDEHPSYNYIEGKLHEAINANKKITLLRQLLAELERTTAETQEYLEVLKEKGDKNDDNN